MLQIFLITKKDSVELSFLYENENLTFYVKYVIIIIGNYCKNLIKGEIIMRKWRRLLIVVVTVAICLCPIEVQAKSADWVHVLGEIETPFNVVKICKSPQKAGKNMEAFRAMKKNQSYSFVIEGKLKGAKIIASKGVKKCKIKSTKRTTVVTAKLKADQTFFVELTYANNKVRFFAFDLYFLG